MKKPILTAEIRGKQRKLIPTLGMYQVEDMFAKERDGLAVCLSEDGEPFAVITVSFGEFIGIKNAAYIDTNNCPWAPKMLEDAGVARNTGFKKRSGFCEYPLYLFEEKFLRGLDEELYEEYASQYN